MLLKKISQNIDILAKIHFPQCLPLVISSLDEIYCMHNGQQLKNGMMYLIFDNEEQWQRFNELTTVNTRQTYYKKLNHKYGRENRWN